MHRVGVPEEEDANSRKFGKGTLIVIVPVCIVMQFVSLWWDLPLWCWLLSGLSRLDTATRRHELLDIQALDLL
jgi:hypothetical protein